MKNTKFLILFALLAVGFSYLASADVECTSQECSVDATLSVGNAIPSITSVEAGVTIVPTAETTTTANLIFNVTDLNGYSDLNDSTAQCVGYKSGEFDRTTTSCSVFGQSGNNARYNCSVDFWYFDEAAADWKWNCSITDNYGNSTYNDTVSFTVSALNYVDVDVSSFAWSGVTPNTNDQEANVPVNFDNGGNQDYENATVTAFNATSGANIIPATAFYLNNVTGSPAGTQMADNSSVAITAWFTLPHGNASSEDIYAYVDMPAVPSGTYNSDSNWIIQIS